MKKKVLLSALMSIVCCAYAVDYTCGFETQEDCKNWNFIQEGQANYWMIGSTAPNTGEKSLYITYDGINNNYTNSTVASWTYTKITATPGSHSFRFYYRCYGEYSRDMMRVAIVPSVSALVAGNSSGITGAYYDSGYECGSKSWLSLTGTFSLSNIQDLYVVVLWISNYDNVYAYPGCIDDISLTNATQKKIINDGDFQYIQREDSSYSIFAYTGTDLNLTLPSEVDGHPVTAIETNAFYNRSYLRTLVIPSSYISIAPNAFVNCNLLNLVDVYSTSMNTISGTTFSNSPNILVGDTSLFKNAWSSHSSKIYLRSQSDREVTLTARTSESALHRAIGDANLNSIVRLKINGTINSYDIMIMRNKMINLRYLDLTDASILECSYEYATGYHSKENTLTTQGIYTIPLVSLMLPKTLQTIESDAIPYSTITTLGINSDIYGENAFMGTSYLKEVKIGGSATNVPQGIFWNCSTLRELNIDSVITINQDAFRNCVSLTRVTIGEGVKNIGQDAFNTCKNLAHIKFPNTLETIGVRAFFMSGLREVYFPANVQTIGAYAFCYFSNSATFSNSPYSLYKGNSEYLYYGSSNNSRYSYTSGGIYYKNGYLLSVEFAPKSRLKKIERGTFTSNPNLTKLLLPDSLEVIEHDAFANCGIDTLRMPNRLRSIGRHAFWFCTKLKHVEFSKSLKTIPSMCFADCSALDTLKMVVGLKTIEPHAFWNCTGLKTIKISSSVEKIGDYAFGNCTKVEKVYTYTLEPTNINQNTFSSWRTSNLFVPTTSFYTYFYETQWSQFLNLYEFDEPYEYFYLNNDYVLDDESGLVKGKPDADLYPGSSLIASASNTQELGILAANATSSGLSASILACQSALSADSLIIRIGTKKGKWSFFCFPMDIQFTQVSFPYRYVFREYNGQKRATDGVVNGYLNWQNVSSTDYLHHGQGYIFQGEETDSLVINIANPKFDCTDFGKAIQVYAAEHNYDMSWNYIGNPYPCYYDMDGLRDAGFITPVYVWNGQDYDVYLPGDDEYHFHPFEGFFVQNPNTTVTTLLWQEDNRETKLQADEKTHSAPSRRAMNNASGRYLINITLSNDSYADRTRVVFNDNATTAYDLGKDAIKMTGDAPVHLYTLDSDVHYSINERPFSSAYMSLGYDVDSAGMYTLTAQRMDTTLLLYDNELKVEVNLAEGPYTFYTPAGTNETRFAIVGTTQSNTTPTQLMILQGEYGDKVTVYDMMGNCLHEQVKLSDVQLPVGVYMLVGQEKTGKVLIR